MSLSSQPVSTLFCLEKLDEVLDSGAVIASDRQLFERKQQLLTRNFTGIAPRETVTEL